MRTAIRLVVLTAASLALLGCSGNPEDEVASDPGTPPGPLIVGTEAKFPPFESAKADGSLEGFDIDLMRAVGAYLGREVEFRNYSDFGALIPDLQAGRIHAVCSGMSITPEREAVIDFTSPYVRVTTGVLLSTQAAPEITDHTALDAAGMVIAVQRSTTGAEKAEAAYPQARIAKYDDEMAAAAEVVAGRAHAMVYDMVSIVRQHGMNPDATRILDANLGIESYGIALDAGSELREPINRFLEAEGQPGGKLDELLVKWLGDADRFRAQRAGTRPRGADGD